MKKNILLIALIIMGVVLTACGDKPVVDSNSSGEVEGEITLYTSQPEDDVNEIISAFTTKYPKASVNVFRSGTEEVVSKILAEHEMDSVQADVLLVADSTTFQALKERDMLMKYESENKDGIDGQFIDEDFNYYGTKIMSTGLVVNRDVIDGEVKGFNDLLKPEYASQVIMPSPLYSGAAAYNLSLLKRTDGIGMEFYDGLDSNDVFVGQGNGSVLEKVVSGERGIGIIVDYLAIRAINGGANLEYVYPVEGSPIITEPIGILKSTDNEAVSKAFLDFVIGEEGQTIAASQGYSPIREGTEQPKGFKNLSELKVLTYDNKVLYESREADKEEFSTKYN